VFLLPLRSATLHGRSTGGWIAPQEDAALKYAQVRVIEMLGEPVGLYQRGHGCRRQWFILSVGRIAVALFLIVTGNPGGSFQHQRVEHDALCSMHKSPREMSIVCTYTVPAR
jgi:hypothetical protein